MSQSGRYSFPERLDIVKIVSMDCKLIPRSHYIVQLMPPQEQEPQHIEPAQVAVDSDER